MSNFRAVDRGTAYLRRCAHLAAEHLGFWYVRDSPTIAPSLVMAATAVACGVGIPGRLLPVIRAVRIPVAEALQAM
jgi:hypothetical protein